MSAHPATLLAIGIPSIQPPRVLHRRSKIHVVVDTNGLLSCGPYSGHAHDNRLAFNFPSRLQVAAALVAPPATSCGLLCRLAGYRILDESDDGRIDRSGDAAANRLSEHACPSTVPMSTLPVAPCSIGNGAVRERAAAGTAERTSNRVAECAEIDVLHSGSDRVAADRAGDEVDDEIDQCC